MCGLRVLAFRGLLRLIVQSLRSLGHGTNQQFEQCNKFRMFGLLGDMLFALRGGHALIVVVRGPMVHAMPRVCLCLDDCMFFRVLITG